MCKYLGEIWYPNFFRFRKKKSYENKILGHTRILWIRPQNSNLVASFKTVQCCLFERDGPTYGAQSEHGLCYKLQYPTVSSDYVSGCVGWSRPLLSMLEKYIWINIKACIDRSVDQRYTGFTLNIRRPYLLSILYPPKGFGQTSEQTV